LWSPAQPAPKFSCPRVPKLDAFGFGEFIAALVLPANHGDLEPIATLADFEQIVPSRRSMKTRPAAG